MIYRNKSHLKFLSYLFLLISCSLSYAQEQYVEIEVVTKSDPKSALGIFFDSQKITQQPDAQIERVSPNLVLVKIPYNKKDSQFQSGFATAYVLSEDSELIFGSIKMLPSSGNSDSIWKLPACQPRNKPLDVRIPLQEQLSYMDSLYQIRLKKRELLNKDIKERLDEKTINSLQQIEERFGLKYDKPLSEETIAYNLHIRLRKLRETIQLYKRSRSKS
jgi:hypothetical protein